MALELTFARWKPGMQGKQRTAFQGGENYVASITHRGSFMMGSAAARVFQDVS